MTSVITIILLYIPLYVVGYRVIVSVSLLGATTHISRQCIGDPVSVLPCMLINIFSLLALNVSVLSLLIYNSIG